MDMNIDQRSLTWNSTKIFIHFILWVAWMWKFRDFDSNVWGKKSRRWALTARCVWSQCGTPKNEISLKFWTVLQRLRMKYFIYNCYESPRNSKFFKHQILNCYIFNLFRQQIIFQLFISFKISMIQSNFHQQYFTHFLIKFTTYFHLHHFTFWINSFML